MLRIPVESSDIVSIGYDEPSRTLEIEFQNNRVYQYLEVESDLHTQLMRADSHGQFFQTFVARKYRFKRVNEEDKRPDLSGSLAFVTGNSRKFKTLQAACEPFNIEIEQLDLPVTEIQSEDAETIAVEKAKQAYKLAGRPVLVNDSFWSILALRGFPGAYMSSMVKWLRAEDFLKLMEGKADRTIILTETLVYYDGKKTKVFVKDYYGTITNEPRGTSDASIDEIVLPQGSTQTFAEAAQAGEHVVDPKETAAHEFAKWFNMHRRIR